MMPLLSEGKRRTFSPSPFDATRNVIIREGTGREVGVRVARAIVVVGVDVGGSVLAGFVGGAVARIVTTWVEVAVAGAVGAGSGVISVCGGVSITNGGKTPADAEPGAESAPYNRKKTPTPRSNVTRIPTTVNRPGFSPSSDWYT